MDRVDNRLADYTEAIRLDPKLVKAYYLRGREYESKGEKAKAEKDFDTAIANCTEAIRINPKCADAYLWRGIAYTAKGEKAKAKTDLDEAMKLRSKPP